MDRNRRNVVAMALAGTTGAAFAQIKAPPASLMKGGSPGAALDKWAGVIQPHVLKLTEAEQKALLTKNGVTNFQELSLTLAQRYPVLDPKLKANDLRLKFLTSNPILADQGTYEKSPSHDKEPYDKSPGYDRGGFGRTFELTTDFKKLDLPVQSMKTK